MLDNIDRPDAVWTYDEYSVAVTAQLAASLGLTGIAPEAVARATDKRAFRTTCVELAR